MKIKLDTLKIGDVIEVDCGYFGMINMEEVTVVDIHPAIDLWDKEITYPCVTVKDSNGEIFSLRTDVFD
jgi:hypothetical protein